MAIGESGFGCRDGKLSRVVNGLQNREKLGSSSSPASLLTNQAGRTTILLTCTLPPRPYMH